MPTTLRKISSTLFRRFRQTGAIFLVAILLACSQEQPAERRPLTEIHGEAQGTTYTIKYTDSVEVDKASIDSILEYIDHSLSAWDSSSVLSRFNRADTVTVFDTLFISVFHFGKEISERTGGAFHPMVMPLVRAWGFGPEGGRLKDDMRLDSLKALVTYDFTIQALQGGGVFFSKPVGVAFDVNAYAPGYSVDILTDYLRSKGAENFMIELGGELYAEGVNQNGEKWRIGIDKPVSPDSPRELEAIVEVSGMAVATSGTYRKFYEVDGKKFSHTIDPRTGRPVDHQMLSVTVMAPSAALSDAYATAFMVWGPDKTKKFVEEHPELGMGVFTIYHEGGELKTYASPSIRGLMEEVK